MCGIAGFIGQSKNKKISYDLISKLFEKSNIRGIDASGFWCTESSDTIYYDKKPINSNEFIISNDIWNSLRDKRIDLMLAHTRGASKGVGLPHINANNHPFVSEDHRLAIIHNGRIQDEEYKSLKSHYEVATDCDSEIILRIIDGQEDRIEGIKDVFSQIYTGHMAVACGELFTDKSRALFLFRNKHRPLWVSDLRESLGQIFFISDPVILEESINDLHLNRYFFDYKLIELPTEEVWSFILNDHIQISRYKVHKDNFKHEIKREYKKIRQKESFLGIVTGVKKQKKIYKESNSRQLNSFIEKNVISEDFIVEIEKKCDKLNSSINDIKNSVITLAREQSILLQDFEQLLAILNEQVEILKNTKNSLGI